MDTTEKLTIESEVEKLPSLQKDPIEEKTDTLKPENKKKGCLGKGCLVSFLIFSVGLLLLSIAGGKDLVFNMVAGILYVLSLIFGISYVEMNIIVYYIIIPLTWCFMLDSIFKVHYLKIASVTGYFLLFLFIDNWTKFCAWAFRKSITLLNYPYDWTKHEFSDTAIMDNGIIMNSKIFMGQYYVRNSLIICVFVPLIVYAVLIYLLVNKKRVNKQ